MAKMLQDDNIMAEQATEVHCFYAFSVLEAYLHGQPVPEPEGLFKDSHTALFVTWNKHSGPDPLDHRLRGCIGTLAPRMLHTALKDYALTAALRDSRFSPVSRKELPQLSCKVSLLSCFEEAPGGWSDWQVGKHGIIINFTDPDLQCARSATYLPEVAPEQGWSHKDAVLSLIRKAGYDGHVSSSLLSSIKLTRYQSTVKGVSYAQYAAWKGSQGAGVVAGAEDLEVALA